MTLADLPTAYSAARAEASAAALVVDDVPLNTCRYCGHYFRLPTGTTTTLDGHARCCVSLQFQRALYELWWSTPGLGKECIAEICGVSVVAVQKWLANVERNGRAA